jgi:hypothetical protein
MCFNTWLYPPEIAIIARLQVLLDCLAARLDFVSHHNVAARLFLLVLCEGLRIVWSELARFACLKKSFADKCRLETNSKVRCFSI